MPQLLRTRCGLLKMIDSHVVRIAENKDSLNLILKTNSDFGFILKNNDFNLIKGFIESVRYPQLLFQSRVLKVADAGEIERRRGNKIPGATSTWVTGCQELTGCGVLQMPVTLNGGMVMNSWYDIYSIDKIDARQDVEGLKESARYTQTAGVL